MSGPAAAPGAAPVQEVKTIDASNRAVARPEIDLDAYCARIGYEGALAPSLDTLRALCVLHPAAITFEAIDVLLGKGVDISPAAIDAKLLRASRGGYCYEQNGLLKRALEAIGFQVESLLARVRWMMPAGGATPPRSHMALRVRHEGEEWLVDAGFGGYMPTAPLRFDIIEAQSTPHETYRITPFGASHLLQMLQGEHWAPVYEISPEALYPVDFEAPNWFTATHPSSLFRQNLIVARSTSEARYRLLDNRLTVQAVDGTVERHSLTAKGIEDALADVFKLPVAPEWLPIIEQAASRHVDPD